MRVKLDGKDVDESGWRRGYPPVDPRVERDWMERWEVSWTPGGVVWHRRKTTSACQYKRPIKERRSPVHDEPECASS